MNNLKKRRYLEFDCFEEYKEGGASVVLHVVVQAESLRKKKMRQECTMQSHFKGFDYNYQMKG